MVQFLLPFEREIAELEERIAHLKSQGDEEGAADLEAELQRRLKEIAENLTPYERVLLARHPMRP